MALHIRFDKAAFNGRRRPHHFQPPCGCYGSGLYYSEPDGKAYYCDCAIGLALEAADLAEAELSERQCADERAGGSDVLRP